MGIYPYCFNNKIDLVKSGQPFFNRLEELIKNAKSEIHFQIYIFEPDETGKVIADLLIEAAQRGVKIYLVMDAYGSKNFPESWQSRFKNAGIELYFFSPLKIGNYFHMGMRLHHKIICFDRQFAMVGGINISDNYSGYNQELPWLDFALFVEGKILQDLIQICKGTLKTVNSPFKKQKNLFPKEIIKDQTPVAARVLQNNWLQAKFGITRQYRKKIRKAETQITIFGSYFIPSIGLKRSLKRAAQRGVSVNIILGAISDVGIVKHATEYFYSDMLLAGIHLYEWKESVLHGKLALIDNNWLSVGSYNINHLSDFGSIECNLEIKDEAFCKNTALQVNQIIQEGCESLSLLQYKKRYGLFSEIYNALCYGLVRLSLNFLFFLQGRNSRRKVFAHQL